MQAKGPPRGKEYQLPRPIELTMASEPEVEIYWALKQLKVLFAIQVDYEGGAGYPGGTKVDFELLDRPMDLYYNGPYWHDSAYSQVKDMMNALLLRARGRIPVIIWWYEHVGQKMVDVVQRKIGYSLGRI